MSRHCRFCHTPLAHTFADLGLSPLSNSYVKAERLNQGEMFYPLHAWVCPSCKLVQLEEFERAENIFNDEYAYFSSYSSSWLAHARQYSEAMTARFGLNAASQVVEIASNDGYLLQNFVAAGIPALGVEPTGNTAEVAISKGIPTWVKFFGVATAHKLVAAGYAADLLLGNNVLAHVPDINDFVGGLKVALKPGGVITMEFPHLLNLIRHNQFDTIYHEHFSYLSLLAVERIFAHHGLALFDVQERPTHGGSLRIFAQHANGPHATQPGLQAVRDKEAADGLDELDIYARFAAQVDETKRALLRFLIDAKEQGLRVAGYGAPAKGNTLLNYCGVRTDLIDFTVDASPHKQGTWLPGTRIPVYAPEKLREAKPDVVLILPWNLKDEIVAAHSYIGEWGGRFAVPIPRVEFVA
ncbi:class I SAM-dependent methyltransferase [Laribacter hongkongensis]|uniref:class I SAM-dependent methyltransferase n=1 Tax=Laribacter hongkongensis TaxID=168471 RepID=UPI001EFD5D57|nr:class I SAM-dependent methyltransferase [Laribacter hongkongensis]MCG9083917.1 class I SAM-dependent methyltransferase [Laribacter hongkongensis]